MAQVLVLLGFAALVQAVPQFEVASVHAVKPDVIEDIDARALPGGRVVITNCSLRVLLMEAYGVQQYQITGGPKWIDSDRFDITGKGPSDSVAAGLPERPLPAGTKLMLQSLLAERFQLKLHRESREGQVYELAVAKNGPKLTPAAGGVPPSVRLRVIGGHDGSSYRLEGRNASMALLAERLSATVLRRPVSEQTGITGSFDFAFEYTGEPGFSDSAPIVVNAIRDIGLELRVRKGEMETIVIDSASKPSDN